jgi:hypothetical protein
MLTTDESERLEFPVLAGAEYILVGSCDDDCTGLHLVIANPTGYQIDAARGSGNSPIVRVPRSALPGGYHVTVTMAACRVSPCRYGVAVYRKNIGRKGGKAGGREGPE